MDSALRGTAPATPTNDGHISVATMDDREAAVQVTTKAFANDPFVRLMLPGDDEYAEHAPVFFGALFDKRVGGGTVWLVNHGASLAMWDGPGPVDDVTFVLPQSAREVMEEYDSLVHESLPTQRHWYLGILATDPEQGGKGYGRAVMRAGLSRAAADGLPAYLETTNPGNVPMYERSGWTVIAELGHPLPIWIMRQDPPG